MYCFFDMYYSVLGFDQVLFVYTFYPFIICIYITYVMIDLMNFLQIPFVCVGKINYFTPYVIFFLI